jgi:hypothetical protein
MEPFAHQLLTCPLVHAFLNTSEKSENIRRCGLIAPGKGGRGFNSFYYDESLGRVEFVFTSTLRLHPDYAWGFDTFVLIDPIVLYEPGVEFSLIDIGQVVDQVKWNLGSFARPYPDWIQNPSILDEIIERESQLARREYALEKGLPESPANAPEKYIMPRICASPSFLRYVQCYSVGRDEFFDVIARKVTERRWDLDEYIRRDKNWPLNEEILVPCEIASIELLGFWNGRDWQNWNESKNPKTREALDRFVAQKRSATSP